MTWKPPPPDFVQGTEQYVPALVKSDVDLVDQTVAIQIDGGAWLPAEWDDAPSSPCVLSDGRDGHQRVARTSSVVDFAGVSVGLKALLVQLTDTPEVPIIATQGIRVIT